MIQIDARGMAEVQAALRGLAAQQLPYAMMTAINSTAFAVLKESRKRMESVFDRPTPLIKGATRVEKATKESLTATVYIDPKRASVLMTHEAGGKRGDQSLERYLQSKGWLPASYRAIPTDKMPLNSYGNPKVAEVRKIIAGLPGISGGKGDARRCFVIKAGQGGRLSPGIYRTLSRSKGAAIVKLYHFASRAEYKARLDWLPTVEAEARRLLPEAMAKAVRRAMETTR